MLEKVPKVRTMQDTNDLHTILKHGKECGSLHLIYDFLKKFQCFFKKEYFTASGLSYVLLGLFFFFFFKDLFILFFGCAGSSLLHAGLP